jgi:lipopolysaccharide export LptBFGC system permease protein LptF
LAYRWIALRCVRAYLAFAFAVTMVFVIIDGFMNLDELGQNDLGTFLMERYGRQLPELFYILSPFLTLVAALWVLATMMRSNELVPLQAAGYSPRQIAIPFLALGLAFAPLSFLDREYVLPALAELRRTHELKNNFLYPRPIPDWEGGVFSARHYQLEQSLLTHPRYTRLGEDRKEVFSILGETATPAEGGWLFRGGHMVRREGGEAVYSPIPPEGYLFETSIRVQDVEAAIGSPTYLSSEQLADQIGRAPGFEHLRVQYYERFTQPLASLVLLLIAMPLAMGGEPGLGGTFLRFTLTLVVSLGYFVLNTVCLELGARHVFGPATAAFLPLVICGGIGGALVLRGRGRRALASSRRCTLRCSSVTDARSAPSSRLACRRR